MNPPPLDASVCPLTKWPWELLQVSAAPGREWEVHLQNMSSHPLQIAQGQVIAKLSDRFAVEHSLAPHESARRVLALRAVPRSDLLLELPPDDEEFENIGLPLPSQCPDIDFIQEIKNHKDIPDHLKPDFRSRICCRNWG